MRGAFACPDHISAAAKDLLQRMLAIRAEDRISLAEIRRHPWLQGYAECRDDGAARSQATGRDDPLDEGVLAKLTELGMAVEDVERAVKTRNYYSHEKACYEILLTGVQAEKSARLTERSSHGGGLGSLFAFNVH